MNSNMDLYIIIDTETNDLWTSSKNKWQFENITSAHQTLYHDTGVRANVYGCRYEIHKYMGDEK